MNNLNHILLYITLAVILALPSCNKEESGLFGKETGIIINAERSSIWASNDKLSVYNSKNSNAEFTLSNGGGETKASFSGMLTTTSAEVLYAIYPYSTESPFKKIAGAITSSISQELIQNQTHDQDGVLDPKSIGKYLYLSGKTSTNVEVSADTPLPIKMAEIMSIIDFNLSEIPDGITIYSLVLRADTDQFTTTANIGFTADGTTPEITPRETKNKEIEVIINNGAGIVCNNGILTIRLAILPQSFKENSEWNIDILTTKGGDVSATTSHGYTVIPTLTQNIYQAGEVYGINIIMPEKPIEPTLPAKKRYELVNSLYIPSRQATGDIIPDFSRVGYQWGDKDIPNISVVKTLTPPAGGADATVLIQDAIDQTSSGAILLSKGTYNISGVININKSGIVLRGEGNEDSANGTILIATGTTQRDLINIAGTGTRNIVSNSARYDIKDDYVPAGQFWLRMDAAAEFAVGENVVIYRPSTQKWITDLKMDQIPPRQDGLPVTQWEADRYNLYAERVVTMIIGDTLHFDNPIIMSLDKEYGGGRVLKYNYSNRIQECGVENMYIKSSYTGTDDEAHGWSAISVETAQHSWVKNITSQYFGLGLVIIERYAKNITVENCICLDPISQNTGSRRYSFYINQAELSLVKDCKSDKARHDYATGSLGCGPNVFTNCIATNTLADIGPHHRWNTGTLYDNIISDGNIRIQDRSNLGTGQGWAGANNVLWNSTGSGLIVQNPWVSAYNYSIGSIGTKTEGSFSGRPDGVWESHGVNVSPKSLYEAQLSLRKSTQVGIMDIR